MSNLKALAFPFIETGDDTRSISMGLTKHEYAAILIAAHLTNKFRHENDIAEWSYKISQAVLEKFS